jgi:hypothetical protein
MCVESVISSTKTCCLAGDSGILKASPWTIAEYDAAVDNLVPGEPDEFVLNSGCIFNDHHASSMITSLFIVLARFQLMLCMISPKKLYLIMLCPF